jgi:hypothetical protein
MSVPEEVVVRGLLMSARRYVDGYAENENNHPQARGAARSLIEDINSALSEPALLPGLAVVGRALERRKTLQCQLRDALSELAELEGLLKDMQPEIDNLLTEQ